MIEFKELQVAKYEFLDDDDAIKLNEFARNALVSLGATRRITSEQAFSLLVGFSGLDNPSQVDSTYTFVYQDPETLRYNYQTACVPRFTSQTPFSLRLDVPNQKAKILPKSDPQKTSHDVRIHAQITAASNHHYSRVDTSLNELPTAVIASPRSACAAGCSGCSRGAIKSFTKPSSDYVKEHVETLLGEYRERDWDPKDLVSVNITTGSQPTEEKEVAMMIDIMNQYKASGFTEARFMLYNYALRSEAAMRAVREAGADGYIGTIETMDDELRRKYWGNIKGSQTFQDHLKRYDTAQQVGFPIVETNYVVGLDPYETMMQGINYLDRAGVAVVPNVKRTYTARQFAFTHPDVWELGFDYITDAFDACLDSYRHPTIKRYAGEAALRLLQRDSAAGNIAHYLDLPIRHT